VGSNHPQPGSEPPRRRLEPLYPSGLPGPSDRGSTDLRLDGVLRSLGFWGYGKFRVRQSGRGPSLAGLRPLSWLSREPTTSEGVYSEQEHAYHGDSRGGANRAGHCATAVPSLRHQAAAFEFRPFWASLERKLHPYITDFAQFLRNVPDMRVRRMYRSAAPGPSGPRLCYSLERRWRPSSMNSSPLK
jgi:hypothetical protein